jgi:hypothetical protein
MSQRSDSEIQPYESSFHQLAPHLYVWNGEWYNTLFKRRMTLIQLRSGGLLVHSAIRLKESDYAKIEALGKVEMIVVPNALHGDDAPFYKLRYPEAKLLAPRALFKKLKKHCKVDGLLQEGWPEYIRSEIDSLEFSGTRFLEEFVFFHSQTRTLLVTDLVFNMRQDPGGFMRSFMKFNKIFLRFGPSRIFRHLFVNDAAKAAASLKRILEWDFDRVIMSHGTILETGGKKAIQKSFQEIGIA